MYNSDALTKFQKFLVSISIDINYRLWDFVSDIKPEHYTMLYTDEFSSEIIVPFVDGEYTTERNPDLIWSFDFNGSPENPFFKKYSSLEKYLFDEMDLNRKVINNPSEVDSLYGEFCDWLNDKVTRIKYDSVKDSYDCDYIQYGENFNKITFKKSYNNDIQEFLKELRIRLMQTYSKVIEKIPLSSVKANLKWNKDKIDLLELMAALVESESVLINGAPITKEYMAKLLSEVFTDIDLTNFHKDLSQATKRKKEKAPYLKLLVKTFEEYARKSPKTSK